MSSPYATHVNARTTPQSEPIFGETQVRNNAGGYVYAVDPWTAFERFLILGTEGGTYYVAEQALTKEAAQNAVACIGEHGRRAVDLIVAISDAARAPKNDPAIFALALAASAAAAETRAYALAALPKVCRIPTHLFHFVTFVKTQRGIGRGVRRAIADWYARWTPEQLAFELVKYQSRDGWANGDVFRIAHPRMGNSAAVRWALGVTNDSRTVARAKNSALPARAYGPAGPRPAILDAFEEAKTADTARRVELIHAFGLTREMLPTEALTQRAVWEALLTAGKGMPLTALLRNLGNLSKVGLLTPMSEASRTVEARLGDAAAFTAARVHPVAVLLALKTYAQGRGLRGSGEWTPVPAVIDALDAAFYLAFGAIEPTGKRLLFGVDVSSSMSGRCGSLPISCAEAAAVMALVCAKTEREYYIMGFADQFCDLKITPRMRLDDVLARTRDMNFGATDCALPMAWACDHAVSVDGFIVITDNETWVGREHPKQALRRYRDRYVANAKQIVMGMTATKFSIADPQDANALDVVGFDASAPQGISEFLRH
jgi:60 kDa SS-A/Ro ribonucleoprotein